MKVGTGSGRPGEQAGGAAGGVNPVDIEKVAEGQYQNFARLTLFGETVSEFVNQMPIPGLMFSWGPIGSGAIAYTERETGRLTCSRSAQAQADRRRREGRAAAGVVDRRDAARLGAEGRPQEVHARLGDGFDQGIELRAAMVERATIQGSWTSVRPKSRSCCAARCASSPKPKSALTSANGIEEQRFPPELMPKLAALGLLGHPVSRAVRRRRHVGDRLLHLHRGAGARRPEHRAVGRGAQRSLRLAHFPVRFRRAEDSSSWCRWRAARSSARGA